MGEYETKQKLQKLLNKLLREGWCWQEPFGEQSIVKVSVRSCIPVITLTSKDLVNSTHSFRELVSMESQLRQFVCKHHFVQGVNRWTLNAKQNRPYRPYTDYQYWLIESSLVEEKKLAKFLLDNIKINEKDNRHSL